MEFQELLGTKEYDFLECLERDRTPLKTDFVVADSSRTEKTICLTVSPLLKAYGIPGQAKLIEVFQKINTTGKC